MPCNNFEYGAIGVSNNFLATDVISSIYFMVAIIKNIFRINKENRDKTI